MKVDGRISRRYAEIMERARLRMRRRVLREAHQRALDEDLAELRLELASKAAVEGAKRDSTLLGRMLEWLWR